MPNCHVTAFADFLTRSHRELFASCRGRSLDRGRFSQALLAAILMAGIVVALPAQVHPGLHFAELGKRHLPVDLDQTRALAFGDVDGDGDLDLVVGNWGQQNRLYRNSGTGTFTDGTAGRMPVDADRTTSLVLGDVDGDGDLDLVIGNFQQQNRLYRNDGTGTFTAATTSRLPLDNDGTTSVAMGDVDLDGDLDLVFGNFLQNRLYLNNGAGTFTDATASRMPVDSDNTNSVALGDVDGDGDLDVVFGNGGQQNRLHRNDGTGTFTDATASRLPVDGDSTTSVAFGDVDGDGDLDLVFGNGGLFLEQSRLCLNDGTGTYTDATAGRMPLASSGTLSLAFGDFDGDGDLDLVFGNFLQNRIHANDGTGTFTDVTPSRMPVDGDQTAAVALGDVDDDGDLDLVAGNTSLYFGQANRLHLNDGMGTFTDTTAGRVPTVGGRTRAMAFVDVDGDGDPDLVIVDEQHQNRLYLNNGMGSFTDATAMRMPFGNHASTAVAAGDVDGDGDPDLVIGNHGQQDRLYLNDGAGVFTDATVTRMPADSEETTAVALGDVDGDGSLDMVLGTWGYNRLYLNDGTGTFAYATIGRLPLVSDATTSVALGDVDGDGDLDLVVGNGGPLGQQNRLYLNSGTGTFADATASRMPVGTDTTLALAFGDVDGDGDLDLVIGNSGYYGGQQNRLYQNNGTGTFTDVTASRMPVVGDNTTSLVLGDVDGDGDLDLVIGNFDECSAWTGCSGQQNRLYLNHGAGTFTDATASRLPTGSDQTFAVALGDVDGDGDLDLVVGNGHGQQNRLHMNLQRQLDAAHLLRAGQPYTLDVYSRAGLSNASDLAFPYLSTTRRSIPVRPYGTLGIDPMAPLPLVLIPQPAGIGSVTWTVPNNPAFAGVEVFAQALLIQALTDLRLTNVTADVVLR